MPVDHTAPTRRVVFPTSRANPPGALELRALDTPTPQTFEIEATRATVGRSRHADITVGHRSISSIHFELRALEQGVELRDLDSTNKLWFGDRRVSSIVLGAGDSFRAGSCRFVLERVGTRSLELVDTDKYGRLIGSSPAMRELYTEIERMGPTPLNMLLLGETGTGKELTAQTIHAASGRRGPLVVLDCSTLSPNLVEAKLFGVRKGAFTGAERDELGVFEAAEGGSLLLDEVGELPLAMQVKLLRVLEDGRIARVGEPTPSVTVDVRVIAATNRDLREALVEGRFREDLYQRLSQTTLVLPRLCERVSDIALLAEHFLAEVARARGEPIKLDPGALAVLEAHPWPGNVRELRNVVVEAAWRQQVGRIDRGDLRVREHALRRPDRLEKLLEGGASYDEVHAELDAMLLPRLLERHKTISALARAMGKSRATVRSLLVGAGLYPEN